MTDIPLFALPEEHQAFDVRQTKSRCEAGLIVGEVRRDRLAQRVIQDLSKRFTSSWVRPSHSYTCGRSSAVSRLLGLAILTELSAKR